MKFSCLKENLGKILLLAERFTGKNMTLPILSCFLLETDSHKLTVSATNLEYAAQMSVSGAVSESGKTAVPAKILNSLIQSVKEEKIELEAKQKNLFLKTEFRDIRINGLSYEDFPIFPKIKASGSVYLDAGDLRYGIAKALPAVSFSEFKPEITGVLFAVNKGTLTLAATDTFRLAEKKIIFKNKEDVNFSFILPARVAEETARIIGEENDSVKISFGDNQILFENENFKIISRTIEGSFPEYRNIIPDKFETSLFIKRDDFINAVKSGGIFSSKINDIVIDFHKKGSVDVVSENAEVGKQKATLPAQVTGKDIKVSFNYRYLLDGLGVMDEEEIFMGLNGENSPSLIRNKNDQSFLYILMPIKLS